MQYVNENDWAEFRRRYPRAEAFLIGCSLRGELAYLRSESAAGRLNDWRRARLAELEASEVWWSGERAAG